MKLDCCGREDELLDALGRGFAGPELAAHVASCPSCGEIRLVAGALLDERGAAIAEAPVPSAAAMWWRVQLRQRQAAQARARRPLLIGQAVTLAAAMALVVALLGGDVAAGVQNVIATIRVSTPLLLLMATSLVVTPLAGWVAMRQK